MTGFSAAITASGSSSTGFSASRSLLLEQIEHPCADVRLRDFFGFVWPLALSS
jgi:hypothetical protein